MPQTARAQVSPPPDEVDRVIAGLVREQGGRLYNIALRFCGNRADAEDLVQDTFLQAHRKWHQFRGDSSPTTWLYTIAARRCQRMKRRRSGEPRTIESLEALLPSGDRRIVDVPAEAASPLDAEIRRDAQRAVERAIAKLPYTFRLPLVLKDIAGLPVDAVARILGLKEGTVKTRLHRARLRLRRDVARTLPRKDAPPPDHDRRVCLDLLHAKLEGLDRGVALPVASSDLCERCRSLFATLDLTRDACRALGDGDLPAGLRRALARDRDAPQRALPGGR